MKRYSNSICKYTFYFMSKEFIYEYCIKARRINNFYDYSRSQFLMNCLPFLELPFVGLFLQCIKVRCPISPTISDREKKFYNIDARTESVFMPISAEICEKDLKSLQKWNLRVKGIQSTVFLKCTEHFFFCDERTSTFLYSILSTDQ